MAWVFSVEDYEYLFFPREHSESKSSASGDTVSLSAACRLLSLSSHLALIDNVNLKNTSFFAQQVQHARLQAILNESMDSSRT